MKFVVLSSGHVFAPGSVGAIGPFLQTDFDCAFTIYGVGYEVNIGGGVNYYAEPSEIKEFFDKYRKLHAEAQQVLL